MRHTWFGNCLEVSTVMNWCRPCAWPWPLKYSGVCFQKLIDPTHWPPIKKNNRKKSRLKDRATGSSAKTLSKPFSCKCEARVGLNQVYFCSFSHRITSQKWPPKITINQLNSAFSDAAHGRILRPKLEAISPSLSFDRTSHLFPSVTETISSAFSAWWGMWCHACDSHDRCMLHAKVC